MYIRQEYYSYVLLKVISRIPKPNSHPISDFPNSTSTYKRVIKTKNYHRNGEDPPKIGAHSADINSSENHQ